jgi:hypothetical protein
MQGPVKNREHLSQVFFTTDIYVDATMQQCLTSSTSQTSARKVLRRNQYIHWLTFRLQSVLGVPQEFIPFQDMGRCRGQPIYHGSLVYEDFSACTMCFMTFLA